MFFFYVTLKAKREAAVDKIVSVKAWKHADCIKTWFILCRSSQVNREPCDNSLNSKP